jgi:hypothetical protein
MPNWLLTSSALTVFTDAAWASPTGGRPRASTALSLEPFWLVETGWDGWAVVGETDAIALMVDASDAVPANLRGFP